MKSLAHVAGLALVLAAVGLVAGCSSPTQTAASRQPAKDFEVVESSVQRPLTDAEAAEVRASVTAYLDREGQTEGGDYYLKVYLKPDNADADSEWVVVRFTRYIVERVAVASTYPYDYSLYSPYYGYDIYPYGYGCVARISFQYYVDPFYHQHYYYPYHGHGGHKGDHDGNDTAHNNHGGKPGGPDDNHNPGHRPPPGNVAHNPSGNNGGSYQPPLYPRQSPLAGRRQPHYEDIQPHSPRHGHHGSNPDPQEVADNTENRPAETPDSNANPSPSSPPNAGNRPGTHWNRPNNYSPPQGSGQANSTGTTNRPAENRPTQGRHHGPNSNPNPAPTSANNTPRTANRVAPAPDRPRPTYRPEPASYRPQSPAPRPAPSYQPAPARTYAPAPSAPARVAPASNNSDGQGGDNRRDSLH